MTKPELGSTRITIAPDAEGAESREEEDGDRDDGINDLRSLWENISLTVRLGSIYSTPGAARIFASGLSRRG